MSAIVVVQQYMTAEGIKKLPEIFREHRSLAAAHKGFISLRLMTPLTDCEEGQITLLLEFTNERLLAKWRDSPAHGRVAEMYKAYRARPPLPVFYRVEE